MDAFAPTAVSVTNDLPNGVRAAYRALVTVTNRAAPTWLRQGGLRWPAHEVHPLTVFGSPSRSRPGRPAGAAFLGDAGIRY
jgi:hypothetical protein